MRALHRRQVAVRAAEHAGVGLAIGCAAAALLVAILLWRGQDGWAAAWVAMGTGACAGAAVGLARRPSALFAVAQADRQLGTHDLLGTAWSAALRRGRGPEVDDAWHATVVNLGAARVRELSPSSVVLRRFGPRAWGGVTLAVALVVTLTLFSSDPLPASTAFARSAAAGPDARREAARPLIALAAESPDRARRREPNPGDSGEPGDAPTETAGAPETPDAKTRPAAGANTSRGKTASAGGGDGAGQTDSRRAAVDDQTASARATNDPRPVPTGQRAAGGVGAARGQPAGGDAAAGGTVIGPEAAPARAPWEHPSWTSAAEAATEQVRAGRVPDDVRDLVRSYFDRPATPPDKND